MPTQICSPPGVVAFFIQNLIRHMQFDTFCSLYGVYVTEPPATIAFSPKPLCADTYYGVIGRK